MKLIYKKLILMFADVVVAAGLYWIAAFLRYEGDIPADRLQPLLFYSLLATAISVVLSLVLSCYGSLWKYAGIEVMIRQGFMAVLSSVAMLIVKYAAIDEMSGSIVMIYGILLFVVTSAMRAMPRSMAWVKSSMATNAQGGRRAVIVGAGDTGAMLIKRAYDAKGTDAFFPVAVVDNDPAKIGLKVGGVKIAGSIDSIDNICKKYGAREIIVALPNATKDELYEIYRKCITTNLPMKSFQNFMDMQDYLKKDNTGLKNVTIEDLLFRSAVETDMETVKNFLDGQVVMVTGGAGSIGSELCRQALAFGCRQLVIYDFDENGLYEINEELQLKHNPEKYRLCLGSVRDAQRLQEVMDRYKPQMVFHAAAHKHVPMMELNPFEAVKNNVAGTQNVINACIAGKVKKFILISTDKAVNSVNMMGATKRIAEFMAKEANGRGTEFAAVRFGNVLGSNGSVIPKFKRQIAEGGPVTLTHKEMIRYFMTISEAVSLVLTAGAFAKGGEIFVLDMGQPVKIYDLAADLIRLSGYEPEVDIKITITGLRPGEKLYEELFYSDENIDKTAHEKIFVLKNGEKQESADQIETILNIAKEGRDEKLLREAVFGLANPPVTSQCPLLQGDSPAGIF
ncbi:MAG: polysaccharide biosynthesis protein [Oscillospiraceae bacterium]|nr:polysaccharide biosynthesis protein [Oscillospiraceae bacterium]